MSRRVSIDYRIIVDIGKPIKRLGIIGIRDNRIRLDEAVQGGVIVAGVVIVQPCRPVVDLPGILTVGDNRPVGIADLS